MANSRPSISVIIPTLNEEKYLPLLLNSLHRQTVTDYEVIIADSDSRDDTLEIARAAGARILPGEPKGPGEGRNRGARAASSDILLFTDADCVLPSNLLAVVLNASRNRHLIGGTTACMPTDGTAFEHALFRLGNAYQSLMTKLGIPHNAGYCFFFRRDVFEKVGGFRENMFLNETHDLVFRSRSFGRFIILPVTIQTSMRRFRKYGYLRPIFREYLASTLFYYVTRRTPAKIFKPKPAR